MTRCQPCVEKKLRGLLAKERAENKALREAVKTLHLTEKQWAKFYAALQAALDKGVSDGR